MDWKVFAKSNVKPILFVSVTGLVLLLTIFGVTDKVISSVGHGYIHQQAVDYLEQAETASKETFVLLSVAKAGTGILESSQGGISFFIDVQVQLGKAFESLKSLIDHAWEISLFGLSLLLVGRLLLEYTQVLLYPLLILLTSCWLLYAVLMSVDSQFSHFSKRLLRSVFVGTFMIIFALPLSIYATSIGSQGLTAELKGEINAGLSEHNSLYTPSKTNSDDLKESAKSVITQYKSKRKDIHGHVEKMHTYVYQHIAVLLLELVVLPLILLVIFYNTIRLFAKGREKDVLLY